MGAQLRGVPSSPLGGSSAHMGQMASTCALGSEIVSWEEEVSALETARGWAGTEHAADAVTERLWGEFEGQAGADRRNFAPGQRGDGGRLRTMQVAALEAGVVDLLIKAVMGAPDSAAVHKPQSGADGNDLVSEQGEGAAAGAPAPGQVAASCAETDSEGDSGSGGGEGPHRVWDSPEMDEFGVLCFDLETEAALQAQCAALHALKWVCMGNKVVSEHVFSQEHLLKHIIASVARALHSTDATYGHTDAWNEAALRLANTMAVNLPAHRASFVRTLGATSASVLNLSTSASVQLRAQFVSLVSVLSSGSPDADTSAPPDRTSGSGSDMPDDRPAPLEQSEADADAALALSAQVLRPLASIAKQAVDSDEEYYGHAETQEGLSSSSSNTTTSSFSTRLPPATVVSAAVAMVNLCPADAYASRLDLDHQQMGPIIVRMLHAFSNSLQGRDYPAGSHKFFRPSALAQGLRAISQCDAYKRMLCDHGAMTLLSSALQNPNCPTPLQQHSMPALHELSKFALQNPAPGLAVKSQHVERSKAHFVVGQVLKHIVQQNDQMLASPGAMSPHNSKPVDPVMSACVRAFRTPVKACMSVPDYAKRIQEYGNCSADCFVVAAVLIGRVETKHGRSLIRSDTVHRLLIAAMMLAAKTHDDEYLNNACWAQIGGIPLSEMNRLEVAMLLALDHRLCVSPEEYQRVRRAMDLMGMGGDVRGSDSVLEGTADGSKEVGAFCPWPGLHSPARTDNGVPSNYVVCYTSGP